MKKINFNITPIFIGNIKQCISIVMVILLTSSLGACQLTKQKKPIEPLILKASLQYSQYYLWLKSLDKNQVLAEENKQASLLNSQPNDNSLSQGKLILIYSLPNTSLHQPYKAKRLLNEHLLMSNNHSKDNLAFTLLLRDQLNIHLHLLEKQQQLKKIESKNNKKNQTTIKQLTQQLNRVNKKLELLKKIDKNINERG